jgi:Ca2+-dependent lipid-binding protein
VDVRAKTDACLFLKIIAAEGVLAMDAGGTSDPFATARWGSLECKTEVVYETVNPVW